jgi:hypothetical protein
MLLLVYVCVCALIEAVSANVHFGVLNGQHVSMQRCRHDMPHCAGFASILMGQGHTEGHYVICAVLAACTGSSRGLFEF